MDKRLSRARNTWNHLGDIDPMWAILTSPSKFGQRWSEDEFFASGQREIDGVISKLDRLVPGSAKTRALDFGCGIGRLSRALCAHYDRVDAVDVAPSMIVLANEKNVFSNQCTFYLNDAPNLALFADERFDLIYSNIVLQHLSPALAVQYLAEFARCTRRGGAIVFQLPHRRKVNVASMRRFAVHAVYNVLPAEAVRWYRRSKHRQIPRSVIDRLPKTPMEMHSVRRSRVEATLNGCALLSVEDSGSAGDAFVSYTYIFQKRG
jgi:SAM-dependent methyltransferase